MRKLILPILTIAVLVFAAYLLLSRPEQKISITENPTASIPTVLTGLETALEIKGELRDYMYMDWIDEDNAVLPLNGKQFIVGTMNINGIAKYASLPADDLTAITIKNLAPLLTTTDAYFAEKGFTKNAKNNRTVGTAPVTTVFYGYEEGELKCVVRIDEQSDPFGNFVCGVVDTDQLEKQKQFTSLFLGKKDEVYDITSFRVQKLQGDFAMGSANGVFTGYTWMAKRTNGTWEVLWRGNEQPMCTEMQRLGIPESLYGNCYTEAEANGQ